MKSRGRARKSSRPTARATTRMVLTERRRVFIDYRDSERDRNEKKLYLLWDNKWSYHSGQWDSTRYVWNPDSPVDGLVANAPARRSISPRGGGNPRTCPSRWTLFYADSIYSEFKY